MCFLGLLHVALVGHCSREYAEQHCWKTVAHRKVFEKIIFVLAVGQVSFLYIAQYHKSQFVTPPPLHHGDLERGQATQTQKRTAAFTQIGETNRPLEGERDMIACKLRREGEMRRCWTSLGTMNQIKHLDEAPTPWRERDPWMARNPAQRSLSEKREQWKENQEEGEERQREREIRCKREKEREAYSLAAYGKQDKHGL